MKVNSEAFIGGFLLSCSTRHLAGNFSPCVPVRLGAAGNAALIRRRGEPAEVAACLVDPYSARWS